MLISQPEPLSFFFTFVIVVHNVSIPSLITFINQTRYECKHPYHSSVDISKHCQLMEFWLLRSDNTVLFHCICIFLSKQQQQRRIYEVRMSFVSRRWYDWLNGWLAWMVGWLDDWLNEWASPVSVGWNKTNEWEGIWH